MEAQAALVLEFEVEANGQRSSCTQWCTTQSVRHVGCLCGVQQHALAQPYLACSAGSVVRLFTYPSTCLVTVWHCAGISVRLR